MTPSDGCDLRYMVVEFKESGGRRSREYSGGQGSLLPAATFAVPPGVFGKSATSMPTTILRRGTWMLVRLAQAPDPAGQSGEMATRRLARPGRTRPREAPLGKSAEENLISTRRNLIFS